VNADRARVHDADLDNLGADLPSSTQVEEGRLAVRAHIRYVGGEAGDALAAAQGRALRALLLAFPEPDASPTQEDPCPQ